jgi:hypothetical protein
MAQSPIIDPNTGQPMNMAGAKQVLGDDQLRAKQAAEEIRVILEAYDAELFPVIMLSPRGIVGTSVDVIPKARATAPMDHGPLPDEEKTVADEVDEDNAEAPKTEDELLADAEDAVAEGKSASEEAAKAE